MATTTIRLPEDLKKRVSDVAQRTGVTAHALILDAIAERIDAEEKRNAFSELAVQRYDTILKTGATIPWSEMRGYLEARARGEGPRPPRARKLSR